MEPVRSSTTSGRTPKACPHVNVHHTGVFLEPWFLVLSGLLPLATVLLLACWLLFSYIHSHGLFFTIKNIIKYFRVMAVLIPKT